MVTNKTTANKDGMTEFMHSLDAEHQSGSRRLIDAMQEVTGEEPILWGTSIVGFGTYTYKYASGREGDWMKIGFSPRKVNYSLYVSCDLADLANELESIGPYKHGKGCIYIKKPEDVSVDALKRLFKKAYAIPNRYAA